MLRLNSTLLCSGGVMMKRAVLLSLPILLLLCGCGPQTDRSSVPPSDAAAVKASVVDASAAQAAVSYPEAPDTQPLTIARTEHNRYITEAIETFNRLSPNTPLESIWYTDNENELRQYRIIWSSDDEKAKGKHPTFKAVGCFPKFSCKGAQT